MWRCWHCRLREGNQRESGVNKWNYKPIHSPQSSIWRLAKGEAAVGLAAEERDGERDTEREKRRRGKKWIQKQRERESFERNRIMHSSLWTPAVELALLKRSCLIKTCSALRIAVGLYNQVRLMLLVGKKSHLWDWLCSISANSSWLWTYTFSFHLQDNVHWLRSRTQQNAVKWQWWRWTWMWSLSWCQVLERQSDN